MTFHNALVDCRCKLIFGLPNSYFVDAEDVGRNQVKAQAPRDRVGVHFSPTTAHDFGTDKGVGTA